jgi:pyruvate formate-lyase activating enzyme-like uncharacterized protein
MEYPDNHSKGCQICQEGKWLCIYLTYLCNASCTFCPAPLKGQDVINTAFGTDPDKIIPYLEQGNFRGISFSGGECFMVYDRLLDWLQLFVKYFPDYYYWSYTNGLAVEKKQMEQLAKLGMNELRFNISASGYSNQKVLDTIHHAAKIFQHVSVEIPSIPEDYEKLISILPQLSSSGVDYLNLHEYILVPNDPNQIRAPRGDYIMNYEMRLQYHLQSQQNTRTIKIFCRENGIPIRINSCLLRKKEHQMLQRRITMGKLLKEKHEKLTTDGFLETIYFPEKEVHNTEEALKNYQSLDRRKLHHPDQCTYYDQRAYRLKLLPRLGINAQARVLSYTTIH